MEESQEQLIFEYLKQQHTQVVEHYDFQNKEINYSEELVAPNINTISGDEEIVRAYLIARLVNELGYQAKNIELEKSYNIGRPKHNKPRIDLIVKDNSGNAFLYIELKNLSDYDKNQEGVIKEQLFNLAAQETGEGSKVSYLVLYTIAFNQDKIKDKCIVIDYEKFTTFDKWKEARDFADTLPSNYGKAQKEPYIKGKKDLQTNFTDELDSLRTNLHDVLWGGGY